MLRLRRYERISTENRRFRANVALTQNFSENYLNDLLYRIEIWTDFSFVLSQFTRLTDRRTDKQTDRKTDGRTEFSSLDRVCIPCGAVTRSSATAKSTARPSCLVGVLYDIYREINNRSTANQPLVRNYSHETYRIPQNNAK